MFSSAAVIASFSMILTTVFGLNELFKAIMKGKEAKVIKLIEPSHIKTLLGVRPYNVNERDISLRDSPLEFAIEHRKENIAVTLIKKGANDRPLRMAIIAGMEKVVRLILEDTNVDVNEEIILRYEFDKRVTTFLHEAVFRGKATIVKMICDKRADLEKINSNNFTPLQCAIYLNVEAEIVRILLEAGANVNGINYDLKTPLHFAVHNSKNRQNGEIIDSLLSVKGINIDAVDIYGCTPLLIAASYAHVECMQMLLAAGANVNACDDCQKTILHRPSSRGDENIVNLAKSHGFHFECKDVYGDTPFLYSARHEDVHGMRALAKAGAKINAYNKENEGVMHYAVKAYVHPAEMVEIALCYGENLDFLNEMGQPLDLRLLDRQGEMGRLTRNLLLEAGLQLSTEKNMELLKLYWPPCHEIVENGKFRNFQELFRKAIEACLKNDVPKMIENDEEDLIKLLSEYELKGVFALYKILKTIYAKKGPVTQLLEPRKFEIFDYAVMITMEGTYLTTLPVDLTSDILLYNNLCILKLEKMSFHFALAFDELNVVSLEQVKKAAIKLRNSH